MNQKLGFEYLQKGRKMVSILVKFTEICLNGIVIYLSIKLSLFYSLFKKQESLKTAFFLRVRCFLSGEDQKKIH